MEVHDLSKAHPLGDPLRRSIARLIEVVGTPRFEIEMFRLAREAIHCEHLTAFAVSENAEPRVLLAANTGSLPIARTVAQKYVTRFWQLDPANDFGAPERRDHSDSAVRIHPDDIGDSSYRQECYTAVRLQDRFTVMQRRDRECFRINFYRGVGRGRFDAGDVEYIMNSADLLLALLVKHDSTGPRLAEDSLARTYQDRLRLLEPEMPSRETEVCAAIMQGMTSEAIALTLGISVNTVLTYRKRAYMRLGVSSQNELMRLVLS